MTKKITLLIIVIVAIILRFYHLGVNPPSLAWDEASWGYNAYSLGIDGRDEFGRFLPHDYLESFGDFKPPVYAYIDIIPVKIFGLNEFATRFPSAFFGVLTVLFTYFLAKEIFKRTPQRDVIALISAGLLAISPWHINLSRAAFEANVATFFILGGVLFFLLAVQGKRWYMVFSAIFFVLSLYTFNSARIVSPLLVLLLGVFMYRHLIKMKKQVFVAVVVGALLILPTLQFIFSAQAGLRFKEVNIFSDISVIKRLNQDIDNDHNTWWTKIIHNRRLAYSVLYVQHYFDNLNPSFLFIKGDGNPKFSTQDVGQLYIWELPFLIIGSLFLIRKKEGLWWVLPCWFLLGIVPAATARETPHALRIETVLPTLQVIVAYGLVRSFSYFEGNMLGIRKVVLFTSFLSLLAVFSLGYYLHGYYKHYSVEYSGEWQYGYKESTEYVRNEQDKYDRILVTTSIGRPYIYYLFYLKTIPSVFQKDAIIRRDAFGFVNVDGYGKYRFGGDLNALVEKDFKNLYINSASEVPLGAKVLKTFFLLNGQPALVAYEK